MLSITGRNGFTQKTPLFEWAVSGGGLTDDIGKDIEVDTDGNIYVTGFFQSHAQFNEIRLFSFGGNDAFLAKYNPDGNIIWSLQTGGKYDDFGVALTVDTEDNIYVTGRFTDTIQFGGTSPEGIQATLGTNDEQEIFIAKYDPDGNLLWSEKAGGLKGDAPCSITSDPDNNIYITGYFQDTARFGNTSLISSGGLDVFIAKYDKDGILVWAKSAGGAGNDIGYAIAIDDSQNIYFTGNFTETIYFGEQQAAITAYGSVDLFIVKFSTGGTILWVRQAGGTKVDDAGETYGTYCTGLSLTTFGNTESGGGIYVTGRLSGTVIFEDTSLVSKGAFIAKYQSNGDLSYVNNSGGYQGNHITSDDEANIYITGFFTDTTVFGDSESSGKQVSLIAKGEADIFIAKFDKNFNLNWVLPAGGSADYEGIYSTDAGESIVLDSNNNIYFTGQHSDYYQDKTTFGDIVLTNYGKRDVFIAKIGLRINNIEFTHLSCDELSNGSITIFSEGGVPPINYSVNGGDTFQSENKFSGLLTGQYPIFLTDNRNGLVQDMVVLNGPLYLGNDTIMCKGSKFYAEPGFLTYDWNNGAATGQYVEIFESGKYFAEVIDSTGCTSSDTITITIPPKVNLGIDTAFCGGGFITAQDFFFSYNWNNGSSLDYRFQVFETGQYNIEAIDTFGCITSDTINVTILPSPVVNLGNDTTIKADQAIILDAGAGDNTYLWNDGITEQTRVVDSLHVGLGRNLYRVIVSGQNGCSTFDSVEITIDSDHVYGIILCSASTQIKYSIINTPNLGTSAYQKYFMSRATVTYNRDRIFRSLIEFDLSYITDTNVVVAYLSLYSPQKSVGHKFSDGSNASYLQRIVSEWPLYLSWRRQPYISHLNQVLIPASSSQYQDYPNINVTAIVRDMLVRPTKSFGFLFSLQTEEPERSMMFCSPFFQDSIKHPRLSIYFEKGTTTIFPLEKTSGNDLKIFPNPSNGLFFINLDTFSQNKIFIEIHDMTGRLIQHEQLSNTSHELEYPINLSGYPKGIYFIKVFDGSTRQTGKLIIY